MSKYRIDSVFLLETFSPILTNSHNPRRVRFRPPKRDYMTFRHFSSEGERLVCAGIFAQDIDPPPPDALASRLTHDCCAVAHSSPDASFVDCGVSCESSAGSIGIAPMHLISHCRNIAFNIARNQRCDSSAVMPGAVAMSSRYAKRFAISQPHQRVGSGRHWDTRPNECNRDRQRGNSRSVRWLGMRE